MDAVKIVAFTVAAAICYGIVHDQVTAHLCVEYFSVAHPPVFPTNDPFLLALGWGVIATWWVGLPLGVGLALAARLGPAPRLTFADVQRPVLVLLVVMAVCATIAGATGAVFAANGVIDPAQQYNGAIAPQKHVAFAADEGAHLASYCSGIAGGLIVIGWALRRRLRSTDRFAR